MNYYYDRYLCRSKIKDNLKQLCITKHFITRNINTQTQFTSINQTYRENLKNYEIYFT